MNAGAREPVTQRVEWFASWFESSHYHKLYANRDDAEAAGLVDELVDRLRPTRGSTLLDLGCGTGRHAKRLASMGFRVTGLDLAAGSISEAKQHEGPGLHFFRHDMRAPFGKNAFDYVFNLFTSFGYFQESSEHLGVVRNMAHSLRPGGKLVLDYMNVPYTEARLKPEEVRQFDGAVYRISRWSGNSHIYKRIAIHDERFKKPREYVERVAKFGLQDFLRMFALHGLRMVAVYGDYHLQRYDALASPRMVLVARKA